MIGQKYLASIRQFEKMAHRIVFLGQLLEKPLNFIAEFLKTTTERREIDAKR